MYEDAYKQQPSNEELGSQAFMANVRIGNWKSAQQVCRCCRTNALRTDFCARSLRSCTSNSMTTTTSTGA